MELKNLKINFLGDSITEGCCTSSQEKRFSNLIEESEGCVCRNYGIGGTRIARQTNPSQFLTYDNDFCSRVEEMDSDADVVVVFGGTNDFGHGDASIGKMKDRTPYTFYGAMHTLCKSLIEKYSNSQIFFITPLHRISEDNKKGDGSKSHDIATLKEYVNIIREVTEYYSIPVLDLYSTSQLQPNVKIIKEKYFPDGLHLNDEGHKIVARKIVSFIKTL